MGPNERRGKSWKPSATGGRRQWPIWRLSLASVSVPSEGDTGTLSLSYPLETVRGRYAAVSRSWAGLHGPQ